MFTFVSVSATSLRERLSTHSTLVRLFTRMRQFVFLETRHLCKSFRTAFKSAGIGALSRVSSYVVLQVSSCCESFTTVCIRADKRSFSCVDSPMDIKVLRCVEPLSTPRELTLAWPEGDMYLLDMRLQVGRKREGSFTAWVITFVWPLFLSLRTWCVTRWQHGLHLRTTAWTGATETRVTFEFDPIHGSRSWCPLFRRFLSIPVQLCRQCTHEHHTLLVFCSCVAQ